MLFHIFFSFLQDPFLIEIRTPNVVAAKRHHLAEENNLKSVCTFIIYQLVLPPFHQSCNKTRSIGCRCKCLPQLLQYRGSNKLNSKSWSDSGNNPIEMDMAVHFDASFSCSYSMVAKSIPF